MTRGQTPELAQAPAAAGRERKAPRARAVGSVPVRTAAQLATDRGTQADVAYQRLKQLILEGALPGGAQILEQEAAVRLNMSRTPVREAMVRLREDGMVDIRPRHGMRVLPISAEDMRQIYEVLTALEGQAAALVAERGPSRREVKELDAAVAAMDAALERDDLRAWAVADERFHALLVGYSGNQRLIGMVSQLWGQSHRARMLTLRLRPKPINSNREHRALVEAIAAGKVALAREIHHDHRKKAGIMLVGLLRDLAV